MHQYDEDYFERGEALRISGYTDYRWQPERSHGEARAFLSVMGLSPWQKDISPKGCKIVDFGCAKGFFVQALVERCFDAYGLDVSNYARTQCMPNCKGRLFHPGINPHHYRYGFVKDVLEHCRLDEIDGTLRYLAAICDEWLMVIPLGDGAFTESERFLISEYECDVTHRLRKPAGWWMEMVSQTMEITMMSHWVKGIKDKWFKVNPFGNLVLRTKSK